MTIRTPLQQFLKENANAEITELILAIAEAGKAIAHAVDTAGLSDIIGALGHTNVQGEATQKLDKFSNDVMTVSLSQCEPCAGMVSEEDEHIQPMNANGKYVVATDPLDGSSNIDVCAPIGTIFSIFQRVSRSGNVTEEDFLQKGIFTHAAGYILYGSSTLFMLSVGNGVYGFTLSEDAEFLLSHNDVKIPEDGKIYSINQGNLVKFGEGVQRYIADCSIVDKEAGKPFSLRYIGSMVGDLHRNLLKGGIFIYPANKGETKGKLRLLYECIPMSYLIEQAGGSSTDGYTRMLEISPVDIHERAAIFIGSKNMVSRCLEYLAQVAQS